MAALLPLRPSSLPDSDFVAKIIIIGEAGCGKSSLLTRYSDNVFRASGEGTTIGVDFKARTVDRAGTRIKCQIWDTAGEQRFSLIAHSYYRGAAAFVLCFDSSGQAPVEIARRDSNKTPSPEEATLASLERFAGAISSFGSDEAAVFLVGLKSDMQNPSVVQVATDFANKKGFLCAGVCSAKDGSDSKMIKNLFEEEILDELIASGNLISSSTNSAEVLRNRRDAAKRKQEKKKKQGSSGSYFPSLRKIFFMKEKKTKKSKRGDDDDDDDEYSYVTL